MKQIAYEYRAVNILNKQQVGIHSHHSTHADTHDTTYTRAHKYKHTCVCEKLRNEGQTIVRSSVCQSLTLYDDIYCLNVLCLCITFSMTSLTKR